MAVINIDDAYILNETGAQVDKVTGLFTKDESTTSGEKAFAQLNIGTAGSNRNLLDNPWFTVNQRGVSGTLPNNAYGLDRWKYLNTGAPSLPTLNADGTITFQLGGFYFYQPCETALFDHLTGKTVTYSAKVDGEIYSATFTFPSTGATNFSLGTQSLFARVNANTKEISFYNAGRSGTITLSALKLELGSVSTLANDAPPDYGEELAKCMRYFQRIKGTNTNYAPIGLGFTTSASSGVIASVLVPLPVPLRTTTITVSKSGNLSLLAGATPYTPTAITYYDHTAQQLRLNVTASGMTAGQFCFLQFSQNAAYIDLSADL